MGGDGYIDFTNWGYFADAAHYKNPIASTAFRISMNIDRCSLNLQ
jgi:hypothetical protein